MNSIGKVKYIGKSFGVESLTNGKIYNVVGIEKSFLRVIDDSEEPYLYSISRPSSLERPNEEYGKWELIETNNKRLEEVFKTQN